MLSDLKVDFQMNGKQIFWEFWFIEYTHTDADSPAMAASWRDVMRIFCITNLTWKARRQALSPLAPGPLHVKSCMNQGGNLTIFSNQHWTAMLNQLKFWLRRSITSITLYLEQAFLPSQKKLKCDRSQNSNKKLKVSANFGVVYCKKSAEMTKK